MALVYQEKISKCWNKKSYAEETTIRCNNCRALFPKEYNECPSCNMLK